MDLNHHVNSSRYIQWMVDSFGREFLERHDITKAEINYLDEAMPGDEVFTGCEKSSDKPLVFLANVTRKSGNKEVCRARLTFRPS
jgi:medium-chain acyl-[acyl-carrier-protein] hydrolase